MDLGAVFCLDLKKVFAQEGELYPIFILQSLEMSFYDFSQMPASKISYISGEKKFEQIENV